MRLVASGPKTIRTLTVSQCLIIFLPGGLHPGFVAVNSPQAVKRCRHVRQIGPRFFLRQLTVDLQRLCESLPGLLRPVLGAIHNPQVVERLCYLRQISLRLFLRQFTVGLQCLLIFLSGLLHPVLVAIKDRCHVDWQIHQNQES